MEKDSWVRYLQSSQFEAFARDHVRSAHQFADTVEKKMLAQPLSSASTLSNPSSRTSETKPSKGSKGEKPDRIELDVKRSRGEPENTFRGDRSSDGSTGETLRASRCSSGEPLRASTAERTHTSILITPEPLNQSDTSEPRPSAQATELPEAEDVEITIKSFTAPSTSSYRDPTAYAEFV